ncbi:MAG: RNase P subunit p30 family protein [Candidatus Woesearchaeota archaeon]
MFDITFPEENEKQIAETAIKLKYKEVYFAYEEKKLPKEKFNIKGINTKIALINPKNPSKARKKADILIADKEARHYIEKTDIDIIFGLEAKAKKDFMKQRNSGLNQVLCSIAAKRNKTYGFNFRDVLLARNRHEIIGRMMQNMVLCKKYKVKTIFFSGARTPLEMRNWRDMKSFFELLGRK